MRSSSEFLITLHMQAHITGLHLDKRLSGEIRHQRRQLRQNREFYFRKSTQYRFISAAAPAHNE